MVRRSSIEWLFHPSLQGRCVSCCQLFQVLRTQVSHVVWCRGGGGGKYLPRPFCCFCHIQATLLLSRSCCPCVLRALRRVFVRFCLHAFAATLAALSPPLVYVWFCFQLYGGSTYPFLLDWASTFMTFFTDSRCCLDCTGHCFEDSLQAVYLRHVRLARFHPVTEWRLCAHFYHILYSPGWFYAESFATP